MSHAFDTGMFHRQPAWHRLGNVVADWPGSWGEARKLGGLDWEPVTAPVYTRLDGVGALSDGSGVYKQIDGWQQVQRSDSGDLLSIQQDSYAIITNSQFGSVIETVMKIREDENLKYETVLSIYGGRMIVATMYLDEPLSIPGDPSKTYRYIVFVSRHDGAGGLRVIFTDIRVVCANTMGMAERQGERDGTSFVIRHTENWKIKVDAMHEMVAQARNDAAAWEALAAKLIAKKVTGRQVTRYLEKFVPSRSDMTDRQVTNVGSARAAIRGILASPTCEHIHDTAYGLVMASTEWTDHVRRTRSPDSAVMRSLLQAAPYKITAVKIAKELAGVK